VLDRLFKKLDLLIVKAFVGPFIATFFITLFVLVLQFFWLYIDDVVGKGIDPLTVARLVLYLSATLVPLALPLAVLLSSIMTLGNLGETFELIAIKSAGISLLRFMRPLFFVSILLTIVAFFFNNNVLPIANLKMNTLKYDIIVTKPSFDIKEGVFYDKIEGFVIKIGHKGKDDSTIRDVVIYEANGGQQDNMIVANSGKMIVTPDKQSLIFVLRDGTRYQEKANGAVGGSQLVRMSFKQYKKVMDLSSFKMNKTDDSTFKHNYQMLTLFQLGHNIDSINKIDAGYIKKAETGVGLYVKFPAYLDTTGWATIEKDTAASKYLMPLAWATDSIHKAWVAAHHSRDSVDKAYDSATKAQAALQKSLADAAKKAHPAGAAATPVSVAKTPVPVSKVPASSPGHPTAGTPAPANAMGLTPQRIPIPGGPVANRLAELSKSPEPTFLDLLPDSVRTVVLEHANTAANSAKISMDQPVMLFNQEEDNLRQHQIAWHEKITLAVAVLVMFLIGAPLGSIIRKGGIGLPLVFAVIFFVIFFLLNNFGKKFVKQDVLSPIGGMWMATYVLTPIGLFLTYKAMRDSQVFNKEYYYRIGRKIRSLINKWKKPSVPPGASL
jgi:lipopolysaccharide export system permease protein